MKISQLDVHHLKLPLTHHFEISSGRLHHIDTILVKLSGQGESGWGEAPPWNVPIYGAETAETAFHMIRDIFSPVIVGKQFDTPESINAVLHQFKGNNFAKAALETSWWMLQAKLQGKPLHQLLGGDSQKTINAGNSLGIEDTPEQLLEAIQKSLDRGYQRIKLKVKHGWDHEILEKVRNRFPQIALQVDANSSYTLADLEHIKQWDAFNLVQIEQPLSSDDLVDHAALQKAIRTPICLDESIKSAEDARKAIQLGSCQIINIKISRVGGLYEAKRVHDICQRHGIKNWVGGMLESSLGEAICVEFASLPNIVVPSDLVPSDRFYSKDTTRPVTVLSPKGTFRLSTKPGLDYEVDEENVRSFTVKKWSSGT